MRHFHALLLALLAVIATELGLVAMKLPTPAVQAQTPPRNIPTPAPLQDPHDAIKGQLTEVQRELAGDRQRLIAMERRVNDDSKRLYATCLWVAELNWYLLPQPAWKGHKPDDSRELCWARWYINAGHFFANARFDIPFGP